MHREDINGELRDLIFEFVFRFSRFESALKEHGYRRWTNAGDKASPSWQKFAGDHRASYEPNAAAIQLIDAKPMIQVFGNDGDLHFVEQPFAGNIEALDRVIAHANTVRNNLFHGGKHGGGGWDDPSRMRLLLANTIGVLDDLADQAGFGGDYSGEY